jgi:hypothetical protein
LDLSGSREVQVIVNVVINLNLDLNRILCTCFDPILALLCDGYFLRILI